MPDPQPALTPRVTPTPTPTPTPVASTEAGAASPLLRGGHFAGQSAALRPTATSAALPEEVQGLIAELGAIGPAPTGVAANAVDVAPLATWAEGVAGSLSRASSHLATLGAGTEAHVALERALAAGTRAAKAHAETAANQLRTHLADIMRDSSALHETAATEDAPAAAAVPPTLPDIATIDRLRVAAGQLSTLAAGVSLGEALRPLAAGAAGQLADVALAVNQARAVVGARGDWAQGYRQPTAALGAAANDDVASTTLRNQAGAGGVNQVFIDSFFNRYGIQATTANGRWEPHDWCGMFVARHLFRSAGLDGELRGGFYQTDNVQDFFNYSQAHNAGRIPVATWDAGAGRWRDLRTLHEERGSVRTWTPKATIQSELDAGNVPFRSGDVALIDHSGGDAPSHIVMIDSYDAATGQLLTIEGNTLGIRSSANGLMQRNAAGSPQQDTGNTSVGVHIRQMSGTATAGTGAGAYQPRQGATVAGVGRLSAIDFEDRRYSTLPIAQFPPAVLTMSPDDMTQAQSQSSQVMRSRERGPGA